MSSRAITRIFVYGTLQRGQCRSHVWPCRPLQIEPATMVGQLYDLGDYPALLTMGLDGEPPRAAGCRVSGELWQFAEADLPETLATLDRVEGHQARSDDLYRREIVTCRRTSGPEIMAFTYVYARVNELLSSQQRVPVDKHGIARWP